MFYREIDQDVRVALSLPKFSEELFRLTDRNRDYLGEWLPWLDKVREPDDTKAFLTEHLERFARGEALHQTLFYQGRMAGVLGFNHIDQANGNGHIGYWLGQEFTGRGIMTRAVLDLIGLGVSLWSLNRMEIRCAVGNQKSYAIPERLGFVREGVLRKVEKIYGRYHDHVVYGLVCQETPELP